jgi:glycosyltransferase involved in cell wall biosynthesis
MNTQLGVSIPTYQRPEQLRRCLLSVIETAQPHEVPIYVLDDSGDDTNRSTIQDLQQSYPLIHHIQHEANIGIDRNILASVDACPCDYVWLLGEDDRLVPEAVPEMLKALQNKPDFVFANYSSVNEDVSIVLKEQALPLTGDTDQDAADFLAEHGWAPGFIGGCVVKKQLWSAVDQTPYIGTYFAHIGVIFHSLQHRTIHSVAKPLVLNRCGTVETFTWQSVTFEVLGGWARLMEALLPLYGEAVCKQSLDTFESAHGLNSLKFLLYVRAGGAYGIRQYTEFIRPRNQGWFYKAGAWAIAHCNRTVIHLAHRLVAKVRHQSGRRITGY